MFGLVLIVGIVGLVATAAMVAAMLYLVWLSMGDGTHAPSPDTGETPELGDDTAEDRDRELTDGNTA